MIFIVIAKFLWENRRCTPFIFFSCPKFTEAIKSRDDIDIIRHIVSIFKTKRGAAEEEVDFLFV